MNLRSWPATIAQCRVIFIWRYWEGDIYALVLRIGLNTKTILQVAVSCQLPRYLTDSAPLSIADIHATTSLHYTDIFDLLYPLIIVVIMGASFEDTITTPYWRPYHASWNNVEDGPKILPLMWRLILRRALIFASCRLHHSIQYQKLVYDKCCRFEIMSFIGVDNRHA